MNLVLVLVWEHLGSDESRLEEARDERPRTGEGVEDMHPTFAEAGAEIFPQDIVYGVEDESTHSTGV